jgi:hypothetical protein
VSRRVNKSNHPIQNPLFSSRLPPTRDIILSVLQGLSKTRKTFRDEIPLSGSNFEIDVSKIRSRLSDNLTTICGRFFPKTDVAVHTDSIPAEQRESSAMASFGGVTNMPVNTAVCALH